MLKLEKNDLLIDLGLVNHVGEFQHLDEKKDFEKHKKITNPYYLGDKKIEYRYNNKGYRTKNIEDLDKDFVLLFGCSHTEGIGHFYEDIWCNVLLDRIGIDRLNLAKAGSGPDIQYYNTLQYIKCKYPKPKMVIYQWPESTRKSFSYFEDNGYFLKHHHVTSKTATKDTKWYLRRYCTDRSELETNSYFWYTASNLLWQQLGVPVYNWSWTFDFESQLIDLRLVETWDTNYDRIKSRARDRMHDGPEKHKQTADSIFKDVDNLLKNC